MEIRNATMDDLQAIAAVEAVCFPAAEAATAEEFAGRLAHYAEHFWLLFEQGELVAFVDGFCIDMPDLTDEMYADAALHDENGAWQMIFGVNTLPRCRCRGYAGLLLQRAIADARAQGRKGLVLTCKEKLLHYYAKFGFVNEGVSGSTHGGVVWYHLATKSGEYKNVFDIGHIVESEHYGKVFYVLLIDYDIVCRHYEKNKNNRLSE